MYYYKFEIDDEKFKKWEHWRDHGRAYRMGWMGTHHAKRGDISPIILSVLTEKPMHGYEIMQILEDKSHGMWRPSPGSVYPTLQLLEEQDFVKSQDKEGKKIYSITEKGRKEAKEKVTAGPWEWSKADVEKMVGLKAVGKDIFKSIHQIVKTGNSDEIEKTTKILQETADKLVKVVAGTPTDRKPGSIKK